VLSRLFGNYLKVLDAVVCRNKGYGRALLECIEEVARALQLPVLMLCSTDDPVTKNTWRALGFSFTTDDDLRRFGVHMCDLLHMDNTVQA
jgi:N-acetylglutamate synthase-like GNAT family acetyltransferase